MTGIRVSLNSAQDLTPYRFNLFDNGELVLGGIDQPELSYLVGEDYTGQHRLELNYYHIDNEDIMSDKILVLDRNFTKPVIADLTVSYEIF